MEYRKSNLNGIIYDTIEEYEVNKFIAVGGESIVFKGKKRSIGRTYALKFREMERWGDFFGYELQTLSRLEQCSTSKLAGVIPEIYPELLNSLYNMIPEGKKKLCSKLISPHSQFFCIVEDYIAGCDLKEYCDGDESKGIKGNTPPLNAQYEQVVAFQRKLLNWTMQFCEIMNHVTEDNNFLHLDIKPENIMVSTETESITVIDFGKSMELENRVSTASLNKEFGDNIGVYGTNGFAAPECCDSMEMRYALNLDSTGIVDVRSDIFSFGAALWDCINPQPNIHIKFTENGYFKRDLFNAPKGYIAELEEMIIKCTEKNPDDRYQSYDELKEAAIYAEKKLLARDRPSKRLLVFSILEGFFVFLLIFSSVINARQKDLEHEIARKNFDDMASSYTEHDISDYAEKSIALINAGPTEKQSYYDILNVSYKDDKISINELNIVLLKCLDKTNDEDMFKEYINTVMKHTDDTDIKSVSETISNRESFKNIECDGMYIARAIYNYSKDPVGSYDVLIQYKNSYDYKKAIEYLNKMLFIDSNIKKKIAEEKNIEVAELKSPLEE